VFNFKSVAFKKSGIDGDSLSDGDLLHMLVEEPRYFRRPLVAVDGLLLVGANTKKLGEKLGF
jgi:arsenate reductase-like glutaredoxin family protein